MMYTDTNSFVLYVETKDFYKETPLNKYDTSYYPENHPCYCSKIKKSCGTTKRPRAVVSQYRSLLRGDPRVTAYSLQTNNK